MSVSTPHLKFLGITVWNTSRRKSYCGLLSAHELRDENARTVAARKRSLWNSNSELSKTLAKVFVVNSLEPKEIPRLSVMILVRERKFSLKAALCAKLIGPKYLRARRIG